MKKNNLPTVIPQYGIRLVQEATIDAPYIHQPAEAAQIACDFLSDKDREIFLAVFLATSGKVLGFSVCHIGSLSASLVRVADCLKAAILANAASVIYAHNHPSGNLEPSAEDIAVTDKLVEAGLLIDIPVRDHIIVTPNGSYTSLAERGII